MSRNKTGFLDDAALELRRNFIRYIPVVHRLPDGGTPYPASHHQVWGSVMMDDSLGHTLIIAPPGHAKTNVCGVYYPAWWLGNNPNKHMVYLQAASDQAVKQSLAIRDTIAENPRYHAVFPEVTPDKKRGWSQDQWFLKRSSSDDKDYSFKAVGVGGDLLGARADVLLIDDVCDEENMATAHQREKLERWIGTTAMSRLTPEGRCIIVMTRWHEADLADWAMKRGFTVVHMPAISDSPDVYATIKRRNLLTDEDQTLSTILVHKNGPALWPEHLDLGALQKRRMILGPDRFAQMYQGLPVPAGGSIFKEDWWRWYSALPHITLKIQCWDTAFQAKTTADYSVCQTWGLGVNGRMYLLDEWRGRVEFPELKRQAMIQYKKHSPSRVYIEERASGQALIQELRQERDGLPALPVISFKDKNVDKVMRANAVTGFVESGIVHLPNPTIAPWINDWCSELQYFPAGSHDDRVDAAVMGISQLAIHCSPALPEDWFDSQVTMMGNIFDRKF